MLRYQVRVPGALVFVLAAATSGGAAEARPPYPRALAAHYGPYVPARLVTCGTCHQPARPGHPPTDLASFPHNPFGDRLRRVAETLRAEGRRADLPTRLRRIAGEDADGDGVPNQTELLAGRAPGDRADTPTAAQARAARARSTQLAAYLAAYRWQPFEPVRRPPLPSPRNSDWATHPVDAFLAEEHERRGLRPRPPTTPELLLRRVTLDLTGLAPTPAERRTFLADNSPGAYERLVDRLLASPHYGERWGRHWMDVWRYSDWAGFGEQVRDSLPHIWRWRDWIIESLNANKPYNRMVQEMLAGDELAPTDPDTLRATGYLVRNYKLLSREKWMQDVVDYTGQAFLGLTVGCARCHDHMYDPLTQREYTQFRAVFEPHQVRTDRVPGELDLKRDGLPRAYDAAPDAPTWFYLRGDERSPVKDAPVPPGVPEALGGRLELLPVSIPLAARVPDRQPHVLAGLREQTAARIHAAEVRLASARGEAAPRASLDLALARLEGAALEALLAVEELEYAGGKGSSAWEQAAREAVRLQRQRALAAARLAHLDAQTALVAARAAAVAESAGPTRQEALMAAQQAAARAEEALGKAEAAVATAPDTAYEPRIRESYPEVSTGRRLAFARWLTSRENPLAARTAVNQVWMRHFGAGLAPNPADLGRNGGTPSHPRLLDWLAAEFMEGGWNLKALHRLLVTSRAYRMSSTPDPANAARDPDNHYLWRMSSRRLDAELVRDNVLWVAGRLDTTLGGPDIDQTRGLTVPRRSVYFRHAAEKEMVFTQLFDGPNVVECFMRKETVVPQQALAMANSELTLASARKLARELAVEAGTDPSRFLSAAFERILSRAARPRELAECLAFLRTQAALHLRRQPDTVPMATDLSRPAADPALRARENLALVLLNHNDFITVR